MRFGEESRFDPSRKIILNAGYRRTNSVAPFITESQSAMVSFIKIVFIFYCILPLTECLAKGSPIRSGFHLPDSMTSITFRYKTIKNLIMLPVRINDTLVVNLILDTGTRNIVLFGKRFQKYFTTQPNRPIQFSGLGSGKPVIGK